MIDRRVTTIREAVNGNPDGATVMTGASAEPGSR